MQAPFGPDRLEVALLRLLRRTASLQAQPESKTRFLSSQWLLEAAEPGVSMQLRTIILRELVSLKADRAICSKANLPTASQRAPQTLREALVATQSQVDKRALPRTNLQRIRPIITAMPRSFRILWITTFNWAEIQFKAEAEVVEASRAEVQGVQLRLCPRVLREAVPVRFSGAMIIF